MNWEDRQPVVLDNGTSTIKIGYGDNDSPHMIFPTCVGRPKANGVFVGNIRTRDRWYGEEAIEKVDQLNMKFPIEYGIVTNWDDIEGIWNYAFNYNRISSEESPILLTEPTNNPKANREMSTQILFETFNFLAIYMAHKEMLALRSTGRKTGIVLDCGDGSTTAVPVYEGYAIRNCSQRLDIAGDEITRYLANMMAEKSYLLKIDNRITRKDLIDVMRIKEKNAYIPLDYNQELASNLKTQNIVINDQNISLDVELFKAPEALFTPSLIGMNEEVGIHHKLFNAIMKSDEHIRQELFENIVLSGGTTMIPGFVERLQKELSLLIPSSTHFNITTTPNPHLSTWTGGARMSIEPSFQELWLTKEYYDEYGPSAIHRKCF